MNEFELEVPRTLLRLNSQAWGIASGLILGVGLFAATNILILTGAPPGQPVGPTLELLAYFLPGYSVTFSGSLVGFFYSSVIGYGLGWAIGVIYNRLVEGFPR